MKKLILIILLSSCTSLFSQPTCQWAYIPTGGATQAYNTIYNVVTDNSGNIFETGKILGRADMNPASGPGDTSFSFVSYNYYLSKTSSNGNLLWIEYFQQNSQIGFFEFIGLKINSANEIIVVGNYFGLIDFDLSDTGVDTLRSHFATYPDYFVAKYDSNGGYKWAFSIGDSTTSNIEVKAVSILPNDNILIAANPNGTIDVDPGNAVHNSMGGNANLICYDNNGNYVWNNNINTVYSYGIVNNSLDCDSTGNSYLLTVGYYELTVNKFDNSGMRLWDKKIGNFSTGDRVNPQSVLVDKTTGDFYVAGTYQGTVDFDPDTAVLNRTSSSGFYQDGFIVRYDRNMNPIWLNTYVGEMFFGNYSLEFENSTLITVGGLTGTIDFGNGIILSSPVSSNPFYLKLDLNGMAQNGFVLDGAGRFYTINTLMNQSFVVSGNITNTTDMDPTSDTLLLNTNVASFYNAVYQAANTTSVNEITGNPCLIGYPNPAGNSINIKTDATLIGKNFTLRNYLCQTVLQGKILTEYTLLDLTKLASGIYIMSAGDNPELKLKIVKQ